MDKVRDYVFHEVTKWFVFLSRRLDRVVCWNRRRSRKSQLNQSFLLQWYSTRRMEIEYVLEDLLMSLTGLGLDLIDTDLGGVS